MKRHYIFASHGTFANGLLNSVELILGKQPDIHTLCAYVEEEADLIPPAILSELAPLHYFARLSGGRTVKGRLSILR